MRCSESEGECFFELISSFAKSETKYCFSYSFPFTSFHINLDESSGERTCFLPISYPFGLSKGKMFPSYDGGA